MTSALRVILVDAEALGRCPLCQYELRLWVTEPGDVLSVDVEIRATLA